MYGWRARIGLVVPCTNTTMEPEFNLLGARLEGVAVCASRMHIDVANKGLTKEALIDMEPRAMTIAIPELVHAGVDAIIYGCTSGSFVDGEGWDQRIVSKIQDITSAHLDLEPFSICLRPILFAI